jgi:hypothetical protein
MHVGDRCTFTVGSSTVEVVVRDVRDDGLVLVQNEVSGAGAYSFLVRGDFLVPIDVQIPVNSVPAGMNAA